MVMPEDLEDWTDSELLVEIEARLPPGFAFWCGEGDSSWVVRVSDEGGATPLWEASDFTERGALFRAFHHLWIPPGPAGIWDFNQQRPRLLTVVAQKISDKYSDPEDLDPAEVAAVYSTKTT